MMILVAVQSVHCIQPLCNALQYIEDDIGGCVQCAVLCISVHLSTVGWCWVGIGGCVECSAFH